VHTYVFREVEMVDDRAAERYHLVDDGLLRADERKDAAVMVSVKVEIYTACRRFSELAKPLLVTPFADVDDALNEC